MLKLTTILLLFCFAGQTFNQALLVLDYYSNTAAYANNCVNKARPMMHCNGKCQMMKKLKVQDKKDQQNQERKDGLKLQVLSSASFFRFSIAEPCSLDSVNFQLSPSGHAIDRTYAIFHPPALS